MNNTGTLSAPRVALLLQAPDQGGVERCFVNLARGFCDRGVNAELLCGPGDSPYLDALDPRVELTRLDAITPTALAERLAASAPQALLAAKDADCALASIAIEIVTARARSPLSAAPLSTAPPLLALCASVNASAQLAGRGAGPLKRWLRRRELRRLYHPADRVLCVSAGVADDMAMLLGRPRESLYVLPNPVVTPEIAALAAAPAAHPWLAPGEPPLLLGAGRLGRIKNFPLLLDAFARARRERECRLLILGDGKQRERLLAQARALNVADDFALAGFVDNPYAYMARARLFVLSSRWEGFGNVLVEALACGTPAVSTDCPSGPADILQGGEIGALVPPGDATALAAAILASLDQTPDPARLRAAAAPYTLERSAAAYLDALGVND